MTRYVQNIRRRLKSHPVTHLAYRVTVGVVGLLVVVLGLVLVPFPGPGWLVVILGLLILATEFAWAQRWLAKLRRVLHVWTSWLARQSGWVRALVALATAVFVGAVLYAMALLTGVPTWVPGWLVPPLPGLEQYTTWASAGMLLGGAATRQPIGG